MSESAEAESRARKMLIRALDNLMRFDRGTYGERDAIHRALPHAIEAMIDARVEKIIASRMDECAKKAHIEGEPTTRRETECG